WTENADRGDGQAHSKIQLLHQPLNVIGAITRTVKVHQPRPEGRAEDDEIQRSGNHRRGNALQQCSPGSRHFETVDGAHCMDIHHWAFSRSIKMVSRELWLDCRSLKAIPPSLSALSSSAMPVCSFWASKV